MEDSKQDKPENYLNEVQEAFEVGIRSCQSDSEVKSYYHSVMSELMRKKIVSSHGFGQCEITHEHIGLTFAYRPNVEFFHQNDLAEQPRFVFLKDKRKSISIEDMVNQMDQTMEEMKEDLVEDVVESPEEDMVNNLLEEVEGMFGEDDG